MFRRGAATSTRGVILTEETPDWMRVTRAIILKGLGAIINPPRVAVSYFQNNLLDGNVAIHNEIKFINIKETSRSTYINQVRFEKSKFTST